jgi:hypothetical protein
MLVMSKNKGPVKPMIKAKCKKNNKPEEMW